MLKAAERFLPVLLLLVAAPIGLPSDRAAALSPDQQQVLSDVDALLAALSADSTKAGVSIGACDEA